MQHQNPVMEWLREGGPWGERPKVIETHAAMVFLMGNRAYKLKKSVDLGYLDFSTCEKRHAALLAEMTLNRRTAPDLYVALLSITQAGGNFALNGQGKAIDWLLVMRRFEEGALLSDMAQSGHLSMDLLDRLASRIAAFHDMTSVQPDRPWPASFENVLRGNRTDLIHLARDGRLNSDDVHAEGVAIAQAFAAAHQMLDAETPAIRHCHGDLHLANIFVENGVPTIFDCLEFDADLARIPPLYDIAFLAMDLIARNIPDGASRVINGWLAHQSDGSIAARLGLLPLYLAARAEIRAKVAATLRASDEASRYLGLAQTFLEKSQPRIVAIGGLSGTGKSTLARSLAPRLRPHPGAIHLRTDDLRKRLAGVSLTTRLTQSAYEKHTSEYTYRTLLKWAQDALKSGMSVIVDGVFANPAERAQCEAAAAECKVFFSGLWLEANPAILKARVAARRNDVSDATPDVVARQMLYDLGMIAWNRVDASGGEASTLAQAIAALQLEAPLTK